MHEKRRNVNPFNNFWLKRKFKTVHHQNVEAIGKAAMQHGLDIISFWCPFRYRASPCINVSLNEMGSNIENKNLIFLKIDKKLN
jgi:hypothetical protein